MSNEVVKVCTDYDVAAMEAEHAEMDAMTPDQWDAFDEEHGMSVLEYHHRRSELESVYGTRRALATYAKLAGTTEKSEHMLSDDGLRIAREAPELPIAAALWSVRMGQKVAIERSTEDDTSIELFDVLDKRLYRHEHDCDACVYLGIFEDYDLWIHPRDSDHEQRMHGSMIARDGECGEYASSPICMLGRVVDQYIQRGWDDLVDHQLALLYGIGRAIRLGMVSYWNLLDSLTDISAHGLRLFFEKRRDSGEHSMYGPLPDFLCYY